MEVGQTAERDSLAARTRDGTREGFIIPIGGAEEKIGDTRILSKFVHLCGGEDAHIAIIPTASELDDAGSTYEEVFHRIGVKSARQRSAEFMAHGGQELGLGVARRFRFVARFLEVSRQTE